MESIYLFNLNVTQSNLNVALVVYKV
jgi:hypothetical protein